MKISDIETDALMEKWSKKYKRSIDCSNPKGFSQRAHCSARGARQAGKNTKSKSVNETKDLYKKFKYDVSYEIFGQDNLRSLYTGSVYANTPEEAILISKSIVGGKNHKVTRAFLVNPILSSKELLELFMPMIDKMKYDPNNYSYLGRYGKFRIYAIKDKNRIEFFYKEPASGILHHVKENKVIPMPTTVNLTAWKTPDITRPSDIEEFSVDRESVRDLIAELKDEGYTVKIHPVGTVYKNGKVVKGQLSEDSMSLHDKYPSESRVYRNEEIEDKSKDNLSEIDYADMLDSENISPDSIMRSGKVIGNIEGNDVVMLAKGSQTVYILKVDGRASAFIGFDGKHLKNIKNFTKTAGAIRALIGYLIHKNNMKIIISPDEPLTIDGIQWIIRLISEPRGLIVRNDTGKDIDPVKLKQEWQEAKKTGIPGPTGITISENIKFGNKLRENESRRNSESLLMPFNFYSIGVVKQDLSEDSMSLRDWFGKGKHGGAGGGGWDRYNTKGERIGKCGERKSGEGKPKCLSKAKAASLRAKGGKKAIAAAVNKKRREDPNPTRKGKAKMVSNKTRSDE